MITFSKPVTEEVSVGSSEMLARDVSLSDKAAVVTGASSGIGQAIAIALAAAGAKVCAVGRDRGRLEQTASLASGSARLVPFQADLLVPESTDRLHATVNREFERLDILVHSSGVIQHNLMKNARIEDLDEQYASDLRAPYALTKSLLPLLQAAHGHIVFINSTLGLNAKRAEVGQFAAMQHGLKALADSLREEVNQDGVRVLSVFLGRTATPRQSRLHQKEGKPYRPELLMQPADVAATILAALRLPRTAELTDLSMRPMLKSY